MKGCISKCHLANITKQCNSLWERPIIGAFPVREKLNHGALITDHISDLLWIREGHTGEF